MGEYDYLKTFTIWENDSALFNITEIAALWIGVKPEDLSDFLAAYYEDLSWIKEEEWMRDKRLSNKIHSDMNRAESAIYDAWELGHLPVTICDMNGNPIKFSRADITAWIQQKYPNTPQNFFTTPLSEEHGQQPNTYRPRHSNPELETIIEVSRIYWDKIEGKADKEGKAIDTKEMIASIYRQRTGEEPKDTALTRMDVVARPPFFKTR